MTNKAENMQKLNILLILIVISILTWRKMEMKNGYPAVIEQYSVQIIFLRNNLGGAIFLQESPMFFLVY